jgi:predicted nucleic acid-binding Zn ribbon protein
MERLGSTILDAIRTMEGARLARVLAGYREELGCQWKSPRDIERLQLLISTMEKELKRREQN